MQEKEFQKVRLSVLAFIFIISSLLFSFPRPTQTLFRGADLKVSQEPIHAAPAVFPYQTKKVQVPEVTAKGVLVLEPDSHTILWSKNEGQQLPMASLTKLMTALVVWDNLSLAQEVVVPSLKRDDSPAQLGSVMGLNDGERVTVETLLWGMLVNSGNDAVGVLVNAFPGGQQAFVVEMNKKARQLNLDQTHYTNPTGWDNKDHYSTVEDSAHLAVYFLRNPTLASIVSTESKVVTSVLIENPEQGRRIERWYHLKNTNPLLGEVRGVIGVKTGYTEQAGECLIT
ncbi:serine hydrolase, partial [Patescibacteria group bacterium]|nr:serine hydrolase [Patescibacteria group bacterium]